MAIYNLFFLVQPVMIMAFTGSHRAFTVETFFFKTVETFCFLF